jgi:hypothetical protein
MDNFTPQERAAFSHRIGEIILASAHYEGVLTICVHGAFGLIGPDEKTPRLPPSYAAKVRYLKRVMRDQPPMKKFNEDVRALFARAAPIERVRHAIVHGYLSGFDRKSSVIKFTRHDSTLDENQNEVGQSVFNYLSLTRLEEVGRECPELALDMAKLLMRFSEVLPTQNG